MREIKFRGKTGTTEGKKWVYGNYYKVKSFFNDKIGHFIGMIRNNHLIDFSIDENTLGQYTGLKDKNGKEIYEGDIISMQGDLKSFVSKIEWERDISAFIIKDYGVLSIDNIDFIAVIGNIYDNPELLGGNK